MEDCDFEVRIPSVVNQDTRRSEGQDNTGSGYQGKQKTRISESDALMSGYTLTDMRIS